MKNTNRLIDTDFEKSKIEKLLNLANIYWFKVNNRNNRKRCEICKWNIQSEMFKVNNKNTRTTSMTLFGRFYC